MSPTAAAPPRPKTEHLEIGKLFPDPENPRLPEREKPRTPDELVLLLAKDYSLKDLARSISINGFFDEEPLAAIKRRADEYTVVEGNRRLAAMKLLTDPRLRARTGDPEWDEIYQQRQQEIDKVPVVVYGRRNELLTFMGFRHITGVKPWEPLAKARFIHALVEEHGMDFRKAARTVGSRSNAIKQQYFAYLAYLQARDHFDVDVDRLESVYSTFYVALRNPAIREFLGIPEAKANSDTAKAMASPIPKSKGEALGELVVWFGGDKEHTPIIVNNSYLSDLAEVVASPPALSLLRVSWNLQAAHELVAGEETRLLEHLTTASFHLDEALRNAHRHKKSKKVAEAVKRCSETLEQIAKALAP